MNVVNIVRDIFSSETIVWITKGGEYKASQQNKLLGRIYRWLYPDQYIDCSTIWRAHREINNLIKGLKRDREDSYITPCLRLDQLKNACRELKEEESRLLLSRIDTVVGKFFGNVPEQKESTISSDVEEYLSLFINSSSPSTLDRTRCVKKLSGKPEVASFIAKFFFEPAVVESLSRRKPEDFLRVCTFLNYFSYDFGADEFIKVMNAHGFHACLKKEFLIPLFTRWISDFNKKRPDVAERIHKLQEYFSVINYSPEGWLNEADDWKKVRLGLEKILSGFFEREQTLVQKRKITFLEKPYAVSEKSSFPEKEEVNRWLVSLHDADGVVTTFQRELTQGVRVGDDVITKASLQCPPDIDVKDREIVECFLLFRKIVEYFSQVVHDQNVEQLASKLMVLSTLDYASYDLVTSLGHFVNKNIVTTLREGNNAFERMTFSFDKGPFVKWSSGYCEAYDSQKIAIVQGTIRENQRDGFFTETLHSFPKG